MFDATKFDDVKEITEEEMKKLKTLGENEYLLKVRGDGINSNMTGFMVKLTKAKKIPAAFDGWGNDYNWQTKTSTLAKTYIIEEKFRRNWKFKGLRHGQSTAWVQLEHPYGFGVEINATGFGAIVDEITMINGTMVTPCYFKAKLKNAELLVEKDDGKDFFYSMVNSVTTDDDVAENMMGRFEDILREEHPDKVFTFFSEG